MPIAFFDKLEEIRLLCPHENIFRNVIKGHLRNLLAMQNVYWKQRYTQRVMQFGDENTEFFHAISTERYRRNTNSQIVDESGRMVSDHGEKSALFHQEFKKRLGTSVGISMQFDLQSIVHPHNDLEHLILPFSNKEIDEIILNLPYDKAPGPDGFNSLFFKKAWHIIRNDVYRLCYDFFHHHHCVDLISINYSYITLVPKKDNPETFNDFGPISLLKSSPKIIAKLLANRLQATALEVVHENQYGFIRVG